MYSAFSENWNQNVILIFWNVPEVSLKYPHNFSGYCSKRQTDRQRLFYNLTGNYSLSSCTQVTGTKKRLQLKLFQVWLCLGLFFGVPTTSLEHNIDGSMSSLAITIQRCAKLHPMLNLKLERKSQGSFFDTLSVPLHGMWCSAETRSYLQTRQHRRALAIISNAEWNRIRHSCHTDVVVTAWSTGFEFQYLNYFPSLIFFFSI